MQDENLGPLYAQFPQEQHEIAQRYVGDATFREICLDYLALHRMIVCLRKAPYDTAQRMLADYIVVLNEIEHELRLVLNLTRLQTRQPTVNPEDENDDDCNGTAQGPQF